MKAEQIVCAAPGGGRVPLATLVPLDTPLLLQIFPIYACNFQCCYCIFSLSKNKRGFISSKRKLELSLFQKCVDEVRNFSQKIKVLRFVGMGEPLLHRDLPAMLEYAQASGCFERIELLTNGSLLTTTMADKLAHIGLTRVIISLQGITAQKYYDTSKYKLNFNTFLQQIKYFFLHKDAQTILHLKIVDLSLEDGERTKFFDIFGSVCDTIGIESVGPIYPNVELNAQLQDIQITQFGLPYYELKICPQPFFSMQINPDGNVVPCYSVDYPVIIGNCYHESLQEIWSGKQFNNFRIDILTHFKDACRACQNCHINEHRSFVSDDLMSIRQPLLEIYGNKK